jgi:hypothetical protein
MLRWLWQKQGEKSHNLLKPGHYRHYKGKLYEVIGVARHSETEELMVVYRCLYGAYPLWMRPLAMFTGMVDVGGEKISRFINNKIMDSSVEINSRGPQSSIEGLPGESWTPYGKRD